MVETLFEMPVSESPRLKWFRRHGVSVERTQFTMGDEDEFGNELWPVYAGRKGKFMFGAATEDEALAKFAKFNDIRLWNEERFDDIVDELVLQNTK